VEADLKPKGNRWFTPKTAVNAKTPRSKGARDREMARERQAEMTYLVSGRKRVISSGGMGLIDPVLDSLPRVIIQTAFQQ
jgi:hypothetical protein